MTLDHTRYARLCLGAAASLLVLSIWLPAIQFGDRSLSGGHAALFAAMLLPLVLRLGPALEGGITAQALFLGGYLWLLLVLDGWILWVVASGLWGGGRSFAAWSRRVSLVAVALVAAAPWLPWPVVLGPLGWKDANVSPAVGHFVWLGAYVLAAAGLHLGAPTEGRTSPLR